MATSVLKHLRDDMLNPGSWNALWKLDFSLFLVPITSPGKISCVSIFSHVKIFPFRVCISLPPLRTVQKETRQYFPLGSCHIPFPWTKLCDFYLFGGKPTCPSRVCDFRRIITRLILISNEWMQAESNTSSIERWAISGERRITEESKVTSACTKCHQAKNLTFFVPLPEKMITQNFLKVTAYLRGMPKLTFRGLEMPNPVYTVLGCPGVKLLEQHSVWPPHKLSCIWKAK